MFLICLIVDINTNSIHQIKKNGKNVLNGGIVVSGFFHRFVVERFIGSKVLYYTFNN